MKIQDFFNAGYHLDSADTLRKESVLINLTYLDLNRRWIGDAVWTLNRMDEVITLTLHDVINPEQVEEWVEKTKEMMA